MGQSIAGQLNQLPIDMQGNVLGTDQPDTGSFRPAPGQPQGVMIGQPGFQPTLGIGSGGLPPGDASPGTGGKGSDWQNAVATGGMPPGAGGKGGGPLAQIPIDMQGNVLGGGDATMNLPAPNNLPSPPPMMTPQSGTPGRPVPAAPFTPIGPGVSNPGGGGVVQQPKPQLPATPPMSGVGQSLRGAAQQRQQMFAPQGAPLTGNFQPRTNLSPQPLGRPPVMGTIAKPNRGIGTHYGPIKGAGRGGMIR